eukprot:GGOE01062041.1.p1 GENE.GGOE01062041.1~~GGOE01062041.1.p1  ORF type:complete len:442 (+),score=71.21 GGOE01062041.1:54-1379(+)
MAPKRKECAKKVANPTTRKSKPNGESLGKKAKQPNCDGSLLAESQTVVNCAAPATGADCIVELLAQARRHQLDAVDEETLAAVEKDLKQVVERTETSRMPALSSERELALQRLALLLCQQGRSEEATTYLKRLGCSYRLSREVLCSTPSDVVNIPTAEEAAPFVGAVDDALPPDMLAVMRHAFAPDSAFWHEHCYNCETSDYFSYLHCLTGDPTSALDQVLRHLHQLACQRFPKAKEAQYVEWWAHCRPHPCGHQLHFDSADEGRGSVRNPIVSSALYLSEGHIGGPTLVTRQRLADQHLAGDGWLVFPHLNRYCMFNGEVLHGVIPGRGVPCGGHPGKPSRRVTFMAAFWKDSVTARPQADGGATGAAEPFPDPASSHRKWPAAFFPLLSSVPAAVPSPAPVTHISAVWEDVDPGENRRRQCLLTNLAGLPPYDACFQGF